jgi:hypothetical protein
MKFIILIVVIGVIFTVINVAARKSGKLNETANKAVSSLANYARYFIHGVLAFLGFAFALFIARFFFGL